MKHCLLPLALLALASGCSKAEPSANNQNASVQADVQTQAKSIEEVADAAAKLVEEETSKEIEAMQGNEIDSAEAEKSE